MKISVILTSYNHERFLRQSIESVLNQTYQDFEFIIVDDCSTDNSWDIICEYKERYPSIITIRHEYNWRSGIVDDTVRNYATGDYIAIHHSDDIWMKEKLQMQVEALNNMPEYAALFTNAQAVDDDGNVYSDENGFYYRLFLMENRTRQEWLRYFFYHGNCLCHPSILIRRDVYEENNFFRKGLAQIVDFVKWIQVCRKYEIYVLPEILVQFRVHSAGRNTSGMRIDTQIRSSVELFLMLDEYAGITDRDEFVKIFPEAEDLCKKEAFIPEYAFGKICTQEGVWPYTRLYGVKLLYQALNDPWKAEMMKMYYGYTAKEFIEENGQYDIFGILPKAFEQKRSLYVDSGNGFHCEEMYSENFTMGDSESFCWICRVTCDHKSKINKLRFDPAEGIMVKVKLIKVKVDGIDTTFEEENALCSRKEWQLFVNLDPIYTIAIPDGITNRDNLSVSIEGEIRRLDMEEAGQAVMETLYKKRDAIYECQQNLVSKEELLRIISNEKKQIEDQLQCQNQKNDELAAHLQQQNQKNQELELKLQSIKNSRLYKLAAKMHLIKNV